MFKNVKISVKLPIVFTILIVGFISVTSYMSFQAARKSLESAHIAKLGSIADLKADKIETFFDHLKKDVWISQNYYNIKTNLPIVTRLATNRTDPAYLEAKKMLDSQLRFWLKRSEIVDLMLVNPKGNVVYVTNESHAEHDLDHPLSDPDGMAFANGRKEIRFTDIFRNEIEGGNFGMLVTAPIHNFDGKFIGVIAFEIDMRPIFEYIQDRAGLGKTGETLIATRVGDKILFLNSLRHDAGPALTKRVTFGDERAVPMQQAVQGLSGARIETDYRGNEVIAAWRPISSLGWGMVAKMDTSEAFAGTASLKWEAVLTTIVATGLAVLLSLLLSRAISRPIRNLSEVAGRISQGELGLQAEGTSGDEIGMLAVAFNHMTESLTKSQEKLRESHEYVKNIIGSMINTLIVMTPDGVIVTVNEATCALLGYREEELIGQPVRILFVEEDLAKILVSRKDLPVKGKMLHTLVSVGHISNVEGWYVTKDGSRIPVTFSGSVMRDGKGEIQGIVCIAQDSTQQKQLQCELTQAQKLESVGQLAAGIAHEINTPTQYVGDNTRFLKDGFGDLCTVLDSFEKLLQAAKDGTVDEQLVVEVEATLKQVDVEYLKEEIPQAIDQSLDGVERVAKIVRAMKEFSHPGGEAKTLVNLREAIETTITVARSEWKYVAEVVTEFDRELPEVSCLPGELNQVLLNLIVNATHAIGDALGDNATEKGTITVGTRRDGEWAEIFVRDTGTGIPEDVRSRIFDPFFTTKEVGKGTGQGLAIARSVVVDKHGGTIDCQTEPGKGTTFIVRIPIDGERQTQEVNEDACSIR